MMSLDDILDALDGGHQRATYGAVATLLGRPAQSLMAGRPRDARHSWIVNATTRLPSGYLADEMHPALESRPTVLNTAEDLAAWLTRHGVKATPAPDPGPRKPENNTASNADPSEWDALDARELLAHSSGIMRALHRQGVIRSGNNPVADLAEAIGCKAFGLTIAGQSAKGYDGIGHDGLRWQIKSRRVRQAGGPIQLGVIRDLEKKPFDILLAIIFDEHFGIRAAYRLPHEIVGDYATFRSHVRGHIPVLSPAIARDARVSDVTAIVRAAAENLSGPHLHAGAPPTAASMPRAAQATPRAAGSVKATYEYSRLCFKADVIERLQPHDRFRVITPQGTFEMSKADFYRDFDNVVRTASYRERGVYHMKNPPEKAMKYLIPASATWK